MRAPPKGPSSQTVNALLKLRELILGGEIKAGERMSELLLVERLGVSRTPIRAALVRLEQEGLLRALPSGGFVVDAFNERVRRSRSAARSKVWPPGSPPSAAWRKRNSKTSGTASPASMSSCSQAE